MDNAHDNTNPEFLVIGQNMERVTTIYGAFLIIWGVAVSTISGSGSITSLIPSMMGCLLYTSPSPRDRQKSRMPSSA